MGLSLNDTALSILSAGSGVALDYIDVFNKHTASLAIDLEHFADLALVFTSDDFNFIVLFEFYLARYHFCLSKDN